jgi:hypothetical protein
LARNATVISARRICDIVYTVPQIFDIRESHAAHSFIPFIYENRV